MKYRSKEIVEATQWFKNGDHPFDDMFRPFEDTGVVPTEPREGKIVRYFRHPGIDDDKVCEDCGKVMNLHGFLDNEYGDGCVCPGDYIVYDNDVKSDPTDPEFYYVELKEDFESMYEFLEETDDCGHHKIGAYYSNIYGHVQCTKCGKVVD